MAATLGMTLACLAASMSALAQGGTASPMNPGVAAPTIPANMPPLTKRAARPNVSLAAANPTARMPVATIARVEGSVLVSTQKGLVAAKLGTRLPNGFRVITAGKSETLITFSDGCDVLLSALQRYQVDATLACPERIKTVSSLVLDPAALQLALGGSTESIAIGAVGGGIGGPAAVGGGLFGAGGAFGGGVPGIVAPPGAPGGPPGGPVSPN